MCNKPIVVMKKIFRMVTALSLVCGAFAFTGCTDYEDDINSINNRLDALETGKIASVEEQVAALEKTLESVQTVVDGLEALDLESLIGKVDGMESAIDGLESTIDELKNTVDGIDLSKYAEKSYVDATFATKESVAEINETLGTLAGKIGALEEKWANEEGVENIADVLAKISDVKTTAEDAASKADEALGKIADIEAAFDSYYTKAEVDARLDTKLDASKFEEEFEKALSEAMANDGVITNAITAALNSAVSELNARIDALENKIDDLAGRIQSLVFVPEYSDGCATSFAYNIDGHMVSENQTVSATFQVTPKEYALNLTSENVFVYLLPVKDPVTRSANVPVAITGGNIKILSASAETGHVEVEAIASSDYDNFAIALYVADPKVIEEAEAGEGEASFDGGSYVSSEYVQVKASTKADLKDNFVLYNGEKEISASDLIEDAAWSDAPAQKNFFEGYSVYLKDGRDYLTLAEAAEKYNVEEDAITPDYSSTVKYYKNGSEDKSVAEDFVVNTETAEGMFVRMSSTDPAAMQSKVGNSVKVTNSFSFTFGRDVVEVIGNVAEYNIVNKRIVLSLAPKSIDWTYDWALAHADNNSAPTTPNVQPIVYDEVAYEDNAAGINVNEVITGTPLRSSVRLNGVEIAMDAPELTVTKVATEVAKIASISISEGYEFSAEEPNVYEFVNTYYIDESKTEFDVEFTLTLGQMPADKTVDYGSFVVPFVGTGAAELPVENVYEKAFEGNGTYFSGLDQFKSSFAGIAPAYTTVRKNDEQPDKTLTWSWFAVNESGKEPYLRISSSEILSFADVFTFKNVLTTWYGAEYTFTAKATLSEPAYLLEYDAALVSGGKAELKGKVDAAGGYGFPTVDLANYFSVVSSNTDNLKVKFEVLTEEDSDKGILNVPAPSSLVVDVTAGKLGSSTLDWSDYTNTALELKATLVVDIKGHQIIVNTLPLTIWTAEPVTEFSAAAADAKRTAGTDKTINLWETMVVKAVGTDKDLTKDYTDPDSPKPFATLAYLNAADLMEDYDCEIIFGDRVEAEANGSSNVGVYEYSKAAGTIVYKGDNAVIQNPITFTVKATLNFYLDKNHKAAKTVEFKVTLSEE